jgi:hypothetical protein
MSTSNEIRGQISDVTAALNRARACLRVMAVGMLDGVCTKPGVVADYNGAVTIYELQLQELDRRLKAVQIAELRAQSDQEQSIVWDSNSIGAPLSACTFGVVRK